jgi:hypothetical protein
VCDELFVLGLYFSPLEIGYLWFNLVGCVLAIVIAVVLQTFLNLGGSAPVVKAMPER